MMSWTGFFEVVGQITTLLVAVAAAWWGFERWRRRDEHFPRIELEVSARFIGIHQNRMITEIVATLENKGVVPLRYKSFTFKVRGISRSDQLTHGDERIRYQLLFPHLLAEGTLVPDHWEYSFVYPGVRTEYNYVIDLPVDVPYVRVQAHLDYMLRGESHHAAKILSMPMELRPAGVPNAL